MIDLGKVKAELVIGEQGVDEWRRDVSDNMLAAFTIKSAYDEIHRLLEFDQFHRLLGEDVLEEARHHLQSALTQMNRLYVERISAIYGKGGK